MLFYITKCGSQTIVNNVCKNSNLTRLSIPNNIKADETYKLYDESTTNRPYFISDFIDKYKIPFSFTIIRNPYDRFGSSYNYCLDKQYFKGSIDMFIDTLPIIFNKPYNERTKNEYLIYNHTLHQYKFICVNEIIKVDKVLRLETLDIDIQSLPDKLKINKNIKLTKLNKSSRDKKIYLNKLLATKIFKFYKKDFEILKYSSNSWDQF
jgi:hypothetical protein